MRRRPVLRRKPSATGPTPWRKLNRTRKAAWVWQCWTQAVAWHWGGDRTNALPCAALSSSPWRPGCWHWSTKVVSAWTHACSTRGGAGGVFPVSGPKAGARGGLTVGELCAATVSLSDNSAANVLLARHGGPAALTAWLRSQGDSITRLDRNEPSLNEATVGDERDTTTPLAMLHTMQRLVLGNSLSPSSRATLQRWLIETSTGDQRLRAGAPGWKVGDKTGTSGSSGTANDIGVLWPPAGGAPVLVSCYLTQSTARPEQRDAAIAQVARAVLAARQYQAQ